jgi:hypothetical protein
MENVQAPAGPNDTKDIFNIAFLYGTLRLLDGALEQLQRETILDLNTSIKISVVLHYPDMRTPV